MAGSESKTHPRQHRVVVDLAAAKTVKVEDSVQKRTEELQQLLLTSASGLFCTETTSKDAPTSVFRSLDRPLARFSSFAQSHPSRLSVILQHTNH